MEASMQDREPVALVENPRLLSIVGPTADLMAMALRGDEFAITGYLRHNQFHLTGFRPIQGIGASGARPVRRSAAGRRHHCASCGARMPDPLLCPNCLAWF